MADDSNDVIGSPALRSIFLGNLHLGYTTDDVREIFEKPHVPPGSPEGFYDSIPVARIDVKRSYCFVFLKDATTQEGKEKTEKFVSDINGMAVPNVSSGLRAEFARGDGRVKRKEDERKKVIAPSETLFVVNFNEAKTKRENLQMLFEPYGELLRIDMKKNYAFVQFRTIEQATRAKTATDGGKLDQAVITVEYVARQRADDGGRRNDRSGSGGDRRGFRRDGGRDDRRGPPPPHMMRGPPPPMDRYDRRYGGYDDRYRRGPPPPPRRPRSRSRSRSPGRYGGYRDRSPPRGRPRYDDHRGGGRRSPSPGGPPGDRYPPPPPPGDRYRDRRSPDDPYDRDRGYRS